MTALIVPFTINDEVIDDLTLQDTDYTSTFTDPTETREHYKKEYSQQKLNEIHSHLWSAGRKDNINALHHQKVLCREVILSERSDLHLVWFDRIIYIKPLPLSFLNYNFVHTVVVPDPILYGYTIGFLYSYIMLIQHVSDLCLAHELNLISKQVDWKSWRDFRTTFLANMSSGRLLKTSMNKRFEYSELRLARLNHIYRFSFRGLKYFTTHREYTTYLQEYTAAGITLFAFVTVALTAMQVVVGVSGVSQALLETSYRFSVAVLFVVAIFSVVVSLIFAGMFLLNATLAIRNSFFV
ncbi:UDP-N-acetylglucosamine transferase subunit ALG13 protein [Rutstroemia sp. NJR-2017a BBW]|nr:UDP-N-acetylglucosamine transferase subunit ALG13 protein [Rutstroemia sp. NJR-2017a BBW]PQE08726.1 UDP-N-acetylglucosamine transferase subunit ALG13 protein [Rutstroemia sp. NJR-2017a BBW]